MTTGWPGGTYPEGLPPRSWELINAGPVDRGDTITQAGYADSTLHHRQMEDFVTAVAEGRPPLVDGREGRRTTAVMEALPWSDSPAGRPGEEVAEPCLLRGRPRVLPTKPAARSG